MIRNVISQPCQLFFIWSTHSAFNYKTQRCSAQKLQSFCHLSQTWAAAWRRWVYDRLVLSSGPLALLSWRAARLPRGGTSMIRGFSMMRARRSPFSTIPMIHAPPEAPWAPELWLFISAQNLAACSLGRHTSSPPGRQHFRESVHSTENTNKQLLGSLLVPEVSADSPWSSLKAFP